MAEKKPLYTHEQDLGPGVTRTPGYEVEEAVTNQGMSDRRLDRHGVAADHPTLSTYDGPQNGLASGPDKTSGNRTIEITEVPNEEPKKAKA